MNEKEISNRPRRTIVVHTRLTAHMARVEAARAQAHGAQVLTMDLLAARLAGGFVQPIEAEALHEAIKSALPLAQLGELEKIKLLPGMVRAAAGTLQKVWRAGLDLAAFSAQPRLQVIRALEREVSRRLPPSMRQPAELVALARGRIRHAPAVLGPIEVRGHSEMSPCWRPLLAALAEVVPVDWIADSRHVPGWLQNTKVRVRQREPEAPSVALLSCANFQHEALEAVRWARSLIAAGTAGPEDIALAAAAPGEFDDHMMALVADTGLPIHFVHGIKAITRRSGQAAAALAEVLVGGLSQEGVRRLFALLRGQSDLVAPLPEQWARLLPPDAPLTTFDRWQQVFAAAGPQAWPEGVDHSARVLDILALLDRGPAAAAEAGEKLLSGEAASIWARALQEGPAEALPVTLATLRVPDPLDPATSVVWASAAAAASAPRPHTRLLGLNAGIWPRRIVEDRLIPDHIIPVEILDPLPVAEADRRDFATLKTMTAKSLVISYSRRDVEGRLLGRSPLISGMTEAFVNRTRIPEHAASETDRLLARPSEFATRPIAVSGLGCWKNWLRASLTAHDGLIDSGHPRIQKTLAAVQSATSLRLLLRDPIRYLWKYALGWREPAPTEEPFTLNALAFGALVHAVLERVVDRLETRGGFAKARHTDLESAIAAVVAELAREWEAEQPVPPPVIWRNNLEAVAALALRALTEPLPPLPGQTSFTEVPFGWSGGQEHKDRKLPWDPAKAVEIPGTGVRIQGYIDRLDISADRRSARVIDYKTGNVAKNQAEIIVAGGRELQRCLYAFAAKSLLGNSVKVQAALLYPRVVDGGDMLFPLADVERALGQATHAIMLARANLEAGAALPGVDSGDAYNEFAFALPANAGATYLARKDPAIAGRLGETAQVWELP